MPFNVPWFGGRRVGGRVSRPMPGGARVNQTPQHNPVLNPRGAAPAKPDSFQTSAKTVTKEAISMGTGPVQGQAFNLGTLGDITGMSYAVSATSVTGSGSLTVDWANLIDHIVIRNRNGTPFDTIYFSDALLAGGLSPRIYDWYTLFRPRPPTSVASNTTAASTALTSITKTLSALGIRCAAEDGPWQAEVWYSGLTEFGGTGVTVATANAVIKNIYGTADDGSGQKWNSKFAQQTLTSAPGTGDFHLETTGIVKNTLIQHLLLQNMGGNADPDITDVDHFVVNSRGMNIDTNLAESTVVEAMVQNYYNAFNPDTLVPTAGSPAINNGFTIGDNDEFIINFGTAPDYSTVVPYWYLLPAGDSY